MAPQLYELKFEQSLDVLLMSFKKDAYLVSRKQAMFGKNIIITDNTDWLTSDILEANLARWHVKDRFRLRKDDDLVRTSPVRHLYYALSVKKVAVHLSVDLTQLFAKDYQTPL